MRSERSAVAWKHLCSCRMAYATKTGKWRVAQPREAQTISQTVNTWKQRSVNHSGGCLSRKKWPHDKPSVAETRACSRAGTSGSRRRGGPRPVGASIVGRGMTGRYMGTRGLEGQGPPTRCLMCWKRSGSRKRSRARSDPRQDLGGVCARCGHLAGHSRNVRVFGPHHTWMPRSETRSKRGAARLMRLLKHA